MRTITLDDSFFDSDGIFIDESFFDEKKDCYVFNGNLIMNVKKSIFKKSILVGGDLYVL